MAEKETRSVQTHGSRYFRTTLSKEYIEDLTDNIKRESREKDGEDLSEFIKSTDDESDLEFVKELSFWRKGDKLIVSSPLDDLDITELGDVLIISPANQNLDITKSEDVSIISPADQELEVRRSGEMLIVSPQTQESDPTRNFELPESLSELPLEPPPHEEKPILDRYIEKMTQGLLMSGINNVGISTETDSDLTAIQPELITAFSAQRGEGVEPQMDSEELESSQIEFGEGKELEIYINEVKQYLKFNLLPPLENAASRDSKTTFQNISKRLTRNTSDDQLDRIFSLTIRSMVQEVFDLNISDYPRNFTAVLCAKYLESVADLSERIIFLFERLENDDKDPDAPEELVYKLKENLGMILANESDLDDLPTESFEHSYKFDDQLAEISKSSYNLNLGPNDYHEQVNIYNKRIELLDKIRYESRVGKNDNEWNEWHGSMSERDDLDGKDFGVAVGEVCALTERLVRLPRSITLVGITAKRIAEVHDLASEEIS